VLIFRKFRVRKNEKGLLFKEHDFERFLEPGVYHFFDPLRHIHVQTFDLGRPEFEHPLLDFLLKHYPEEMTRYFLKVEPTAQQVGLVYKDQELIRIVPPASRVFYWQGVAEMRMELIDIQADFNVADPQKILLHARKATLKSQIKEAIFHSEVPEHYVGLLYVDKQCSATLQPGLHAYWQFNRLINIVLVDLRVQSLEVSGQEILTKDKVSLRVNLVGTYQITDPLQMYRTLPNAEVYLYRELQFAVRAAIGTRTFDELLEDKSVVDESVFAHMQAKTANLGMDIHSVGVKDIVLPGEMKAILSKVVEAEKAAQANVIKRREETSATRSLLNTAKVMENNPTALRLKELEVLEKVTEKIGNISIYGGLDSVLKELVKLR